MVLHVHGETVCMDIPDPIMELVHPPVPYRRHHACIPLHVAHVVVHRLVPANHLPRHRRVPLGAVQSIYLLW